MMADLRAFQSCRYYLRGNCTLGPACPYKHDEAEFRMCHGAVGSNAGVALPVPENNCWYFLRGHAGCIKGSACHFIHDQGEKERLTKQRLQQPLSSVPPHHVAHLPVAKPKSQAAFTSAPARQPHAAGSADNSSLVIKLDEASPRSQRSMPQHSYQQQLQSQQQLHQPKQPLFGNGSGLRTQLRSSTEAGKWARAPAHPISHMSDRQSAEEAVASRHQPAALSSRRVPQRAVGPTAALQDDARPISSRSRPQATTTRSTKQPLPAKRSSILARLGPRVHDSSPDADDSDDDDNNREAMDEAMEGRPFSGRPTSLGSRILEKHRSDDRLPYDRKRTVVSTADIQQADVVQPINSRRVVNVGEGARSATAVKRARVVQPLEAPKRSPVTAVLERPALRQVSSPGQSPATLLPNRRGISANAAAPKDVQQQPMKRPSIHSTLVGSQKAVANFKPPKSREQLRRERSASGGGEATPAAQQPSQPGSAAVDASSQARLPRSHSANVDRSNLPAAQAATQTMPHSAAPSRSPAAARPTAQPSVARKARQPSVVSPRAAPRLKASVQSQHVSKPHTDEFEWNVDAIDDVDDLMEEEGDDGEFDLIGDGLASGPIPSSTAVSNDFEEELAAFENAFD